jgi:hypothetical protein
MTDYCRGVLAAVAVVVGASGAIGCNDCNSAAGRSYYERNIEPILIQKCSGNTSGCHSTNSDDPYAFAAGNLDVTSFANVQKRRDLLHRFGPYPQPLFLIKAVAPEVPDPAKPRLQFQYGINPSDPTGNTPAFRDLEVLHVGGAILEINSDAYFALQTWLENGATENGLKPPSPAQTGNGNCSSSVPSGFDPTPLMTNPKYGPGLQKFKADVQPILKDRGCTSSNCHGAPQSDFYVTCGDSDQQLAFNFAQTWAFVTNPVDDSQLLRVPLAARSGGRGHTGGDQFSDTDDSNYQRIRDWASSVGALDFGAGNAGKQFFKDNVQPILIARGCSFEACHSPAAGNDFKLRSGTQGFFSAVALEKNYDLLRNEFMAMEFSDARRGRAVAKAILAADPRIASVGGIAHRGGPVLETPGVPSDPAACTPTTTTPFCIIQRWIDLERTAAGPQVSTMNAGSTVPIVYVQRPANGIAGRLEFDTFQGGADLRVVTGTFGAARGGNLTVDNATQTSLLGACGLGGNPDIGRPSVSQNGDTVAFAGRPSAGVGWRLYTVSIANPGTCAQVSTGATGNIHDFDPTWSPDGTYLVFASTRGTAGPIETRVQPRTQSDLWRMRLPGGSPEQVTVLSNSEINPQMMREGRITMSTEKASDGFYQVSGRRINWDLTDYHPLLAQRKDSLYPSTTDLATTLPSVGYSSATDIREASNGDFLVILSDSTNGAPALKGGAGALAIFNRSVGPFEANRTDPGYLQALHILGPAGATGRAGATAGFRAPFSMPDGKIMASFATNLNTLNWDIVVVDPRTNSAPASLGINGNGETTVDAVIAYKYAPRQPYLNRRQLVFGGGVEGDPSKAVVYMPDAPMVFTLLTGNLRRGRPVEAFRNAKFLAVYREGACPAGACARTTNGIYQSRALLGKAPLKEDGSVKVALPSRTGMVFELQGDDGRAIVTMQEEHQLGPGESIGMGVRQSIVNPAGETVHVFDAVCGGCHGSVSGKELDVGVTADALTGASVSLSQTLDPVSPQ